MRLLILFLVIGVAQASAQTNCATKTDSLTLREVYFISDEMPEFRPSMDSLEAYIKENLTFSKECVEGSVYVGFIVELNGEITHERVVKGVSPTTDQHALSLIEQMPAWKPAVCNQEVIPSYVVLPIRFDLNLD